MKIVVAVIAAGAVVALSGCGGGGGSSPSLAATPTGAPLATSSAVSTASPTPMPVATPSPTPQTTMTPPPVTTPSPLAAPTAPATYAALASVVQNNLNAFTTAVNASCPAASGPARIVAELLPANSNYVINTLPGMNAAQIAAAAANAVQYAQYLRSSFGVTAVELSVNYPLLVQNPANFPNASWPVAINGPLFLSYYQQVVAGLRAAGFGLEIETNVVFPSFSTNAFSYAGLTTPMLAAGKIEEAQRALDNLKPDYLNLESEPATLVSNTGLTALGTPTGFASLVASERAGLSTANSPLTKVGAGSADWSDPSFLTALLAVPNLDFIDMHLYPPYTLQSGIAQLAMIKAAGRQLTITETWLDKTDPSVDSTAGGTYDAQTVLARNTYSFWAPQDVQYLQSIDQLAQCDGAQFVTFWDVSDWFAYVDYGPASAGYTYAQMVSAQGAAVTQAVSAGTVSLLGNAVRAANGLAPLQATLSRRRRL